MRTYDAWKKLHEELGGFTLTSKPVNTPAMDMMGSDGDDESVSPDGDSDASEDDVDMHLDGNEDVGEEDSAMSDCMKRCMEKCKGGDEDEDSDDDDLDDASGEDAGLDVGDDVVPEGDLSPEDNKYSFESYVAKTDKSDKKEKGCKSCDDKEDKKEDKKKGKKEGKGELPDFIKKAMDKKKNGDKSDSKKEKGKEDKKDKKEEKVEESVQRYGGLHTGYVRATEKEIDDCILEMIRPSKRPVKAINENVIGFRSENGMDLSDHFAKANVGSLLSQIDETTDDLGGLVDKLSGVKDDIAPERLILLEKKLNQLLTKVKENK